MNVVRAISSEGFGRLRYHTEIRRRLDTDPTMLAFMEGETDRVPAMYTDRIIRELGPVAQFLPEGALEHDPLAYLRASGGQADLVSLGATGSS